MSPSVLFTVFSLLYLFFSFSGYGEKLYKGRWRSTIWVRYGWLCPGLRRWGYRRKRLWVFFFFKKKKPIWPRVYPKSRPKGYRKKPLWPRVYPKPRQKGTLWLRFLTEAKSYDLLASSQYASVPEPVQNIENNRCQRPFLHWCIYIDWKSYLN